MALNLIAGPRTRAAPGRSSTRFRAAAARDPVLVVPTVDDVERFERELTSDGDAVVGATVCTFDRLFALVAGAAERAGAARR